MLVQLIAHTNEPEKTVAAAAKLCYSDAHIETLLDGLTPEKTAAFLQKLSDLVHVSSRTIISLEKEQYSPSLMLAYRLALVFGVAVEDLCCLEENLKLEDQKYEDLS